ncbi:hypothetical protein [Pasteurella multocida]|uniref:hypothetical protein n=1 Tax=Pasteurella multocida TaxID=747 RepID=UPI001F53A8A9|nr:hypothetical protein [Pasteurella multocida]
MREIESAFLAYKQARKQVKQKNQEQNTSLLKELNIGFESKINGAYLVIKHNSKTLDFYPSTGLWWDRENKSKQYRGIRKLIDYITENNNEKH